MKKILIIIFVLIIICIFLMQACEPPPFYTKDNKDLYSIALHSVLGASGYQLDEVVVLEEDGYGRKIFAARLFSGVPLGVFISQKTDDQYAYYYEDVNFLIKDQGVSILTKENVYECFSMEAIKELKEQNDWEKEQSSRECFKVPICGEKGYLQDKIPNKMIERAGERVFSNLVYETPMCEDAFGHIIWYMEGFANKEDTQRKCYVFLFNADGELKSDEALMEINDIWDYRDQMIAFKEVNGWNKS